MVDEYQDTNKLQGDIAHLLAKGHGNIMAVGDDAQSIYGFRGATHANIMDFPKRFGSCKVIKLEENYRSSQYILDLANCVMQDMESKYSKCLVAARENFGEKPKLIFFKDQYDEAEWIATKILELRDAGVDLHEQAVLFRSAYISILLQAELSKRNIPYQVFGGLKFYETAHVKDLLSHLKIIANAKDELAWDRALSLIQGIGPKTSLRILNELSPYPDLDQAIEKVLKDYDKKYKYSVSLNKLSFALKKARDEAGSIEEIYGIMLDYYLPLLKDKFDDWPMRLNDLETLRDVVAGYESLDSLLADFAIESPERSVLKAEAAMREDERPITLSTIHSAKGLEWNSVFLIGLSDGILPNSLALGEKGGVEEERRIFYVAVTRAKDNLFLSMHHEGNRGGITQFNKISRFVDTPGVLESVEKHAVNFRGSGYHLDENEEDGEPVYNKKMLLEKIMGYFDGDEF